ncbi:glycosyltransferase family 4 protein [Glycomyces sp. TRM65418]|uniref:glycosyltransferase family 4 protein n=1 Tax=Glycomyces sp. TRM65418 TaxID=2867006 RepID=UPI001CE68F63|nr:glycosyltransferase family 4 protein [Glycomyces sp. TRM65418]MCC3762774.1 glycosyltransferase family 4 protein [Glycomyces sp. TRM65418]QZD56804.1 glycosyltransferase family 4 protein [Glycomyces sp. TRM65418]
MRITFLVRNIWGIGGTIKTTLNTAEALVALGHDVTIASFVRHKKKSDFAIDPRIKVENLWDVRRPADGGERLSLLDRVRAKRPSFLDADKVNNQGESSKLLDLRVRRYLRELDTDVAVGTQVSVNLYMAKYGRPERYAMVAQEHLYLDTYRANIRKHIDAQYRKMDAIVTITEADAAAYRAAFPDLVEKITCIPNSIPASAEAPAELTEPLIMTAGRLTGMKGFDILVQAFALLADEFPEWKVRIFGRGPDKKKLQGLIAEHGLKGRVELPGPVAPLDAEWRNASIAAIPSRFEPFGLVIVEAMAAGLPVVCSAVKHGPIEIIDTEVNGLLVAPKKPKELADALRRLMSDPALRRKLADNGMVTAKRFEPSVVVGLHVQLFEKLLKARA